MLRAGDHDNLRYTLSRLHPESLPGILEAMLDVLDAGEDSSRWLERLWQWYRGNREGLALNALIHGQLRHAWICHRRGRRWHAEFTEALAESERLLERAVARQPDDADLLNLRLVSARGLKLPLSEHWARFRALLTVAPTHYWGHLNMLENLQARWCGSDEAMFRFARGRAGHLPAGHLLRALPVLAHMAKLEAFAASAEDAAGAAWFGQAEVGEQVAALWQELRECLAEQGNAQADELLNQFAVACYLCGRADLAGDALDRLDGRCTRDPWCWLARTERERHNPGWVVDRIKAEIAAQSPAPAQ